MTTRNPQRWLTSASPTGFLVIVADSNSIGGVAAVKRIAPDLLVGAAPDLGAGLERNEDAAASPPLI
jgi:hypothetical protein